MPGSTMTIARAAAAVFALGAFTGVGAHMVITNPVPFDKDGLSNAPLAPDGSDFPCKFGGATGYTSTVSTLNTLAVGETSNLTFMGSATHGGGSCQISISTDAVPTKNSIWKTIYSIEGGCPTSASGNIGDSASYQGPNLNSFPFSLPKSIPNGKVTLAWTWNNHVGNRELYMNCAPVLVENGASDTAAFDKLPDMEIYNIAIGGSTCTSPEGFDIEYQNPSSSTTKVGSGPFTTVSCKAGVAGSGAAPTPAAGDDGAGAAASSPAAAATSPPSNPGGVFAPGASSAAPSPAVVSEPAAAAPPPEPTTLATAASPAAPAPTSGSPEPSTGGSPPAAGSGSCQAGWQPCSTDGVSCLSSTHMINCANGCGYVTDLSSTGMSCDGSAGSVHMGYAVVGGATGQKRELSKVARRFPPHARRHAAN